MTMPLRAYSYSGLPSCWARKTLAALGGCCLSVLGRPSEIRLKKYRRGRWQWFRLGITRAAGYAESNTQLNEAIVIQQVLGELGRFAKQTGKVRLPKGQTRHYVRLFSAWNKRRAFWRCCWRKALRVCPRAKTLTAFWGLCIHQFDVRTAWAYPSSLQQVFRLHLVDKGGRVQTAFQRFVVFEMQFGRFEQRCVWPIRCGGVSARVQHFFRNFSASWFKWCRTRWRGCNRG